MSEKKKPISNKVVLAGDPYVGKTCILLRLNEGTFHDHLEVLFYM